MTTTTNARHERRKPVSRKKFQLKSNERFADISTIRIAKKAQEKAQEDLEELHRRNSAIMNAQGSAKAAQKASFESMCLNF
jgi:hypothetical protein